jgi:hypothetical protein
MRVVRAPRSDELPRLTEIALRAKASLGYDAVFVAACREELAVTAERAAVERVRVADDGVLCGFSAVVVSGDAAELVALFVDPDRMGVTWRRSRSRGGGFRCIRSR